MYAFILTALIATLTVASGTAQAAASATPGKNSAYATVSGLSFSTPAIQPVSVEILKGKKKTVLEIDLTVSAFLSTGDLLEVGVLVNNSLALPLEPETGYYTIEKCPSFSTICTVNAHYWLDLDAAELAAPGTIIGQPLTVRATMLATPATANDGTATLRARLVKK